MNQRKEPIEYLTRPFNLLLQNESAIGVVLFLSAAAAIIMANSGLADWYHHLWEKEILISFEDREFSMDLHHLINDGLMAIFFFLVGLEIKREFLAGELNSVRQATLPVAAAIGGMLVPALIYLAFTSGDAADGWGIPMATDIAFALGLISLVGRRVSGSVKVFITSLAVVDDIGAVLVIAFFYTSNLNIDQLYVAGGAFVLLLIASRLGVRSVFFYSFVGISGIWVAFFYSGIHPSIAGILMAFTIPARYRISKDEFTNRLKTLYRKLLKSRTIDMKFNTSREDKLLSGIRDAGDEARSPLQKIEHGLHPFVYFVIMPVFAFANAGVTVEENFIGLLIEPVSLGVICGLLLGKTLGISLTSQLMVRTGLASLPKGSNWSQVYGASMMAGIGFTMSLFIAELAFKDKMLVEEAKAAILVGSILAAAIGLLFIRLTNKEITRDD
ncbi:MAG: Na+/H+ antiporter NhaA [Owenweeksia sp.]|nr:Na+/H+ antiporter NhaA [Owenweeksia sp.]